MNYTNQKSIVPSEFDKIRHAYGDNHNRFIQAIDFKYEAAAMRRLNGNAFKLWRYILRWYGSETFYFSPAALMTELGMGKNAPNEALKELMRWGYIKQDPDSISKYIFTPVLESDYLELKDKKDF